MLGTSPEERRESGRAAWGNPLEGRVPSGGDVGDRAPTGTLGASVRSQLRGDGPDPAAEPGSGAGPDLTLKAEGHPSLLPCPCPPTRAQPLASSGGGDPVSGRIGFPSAGISFGFFQSRRRRTPADAGAMGR